MSSYCEFAQTHPLHGPYHDTEHGFPISDESLLFERLVLEINQAGLNWDLILKKKSTFAIAYEGYSLDKIASYTDSDKVRLLADTGIIRNKLKVNAAIHNANVIIDFRNSHGGFAEWLEANHPLCKAEWVKLFKKTFKFTGVEITNEFLMGVGYLPGAHSETCPVFKQIESLNPPWMQQPLDFYG